MPGKRRYIPNNGSIIFSIDYRHKLRTDYLNITNIGLHGITSPKGIIFMFFPQPAGLSFPSDYMVINVFGNIFSNFYRIRWQLAGSSSVDVKIFATLKP